MRNIIEATIESFPEFILKIKIEKMEKGIFVSVKISVREFHFGNSVRLLRFDRNFSEPKNTRKIEKSRK